LDSARCKLVSLRLQCRQIKVIAQSCGEVTVTAQNAGERTELGYPLRRQVVLRREFDLEPSCELAPPNWGECLDHPHDHARQLTFPNSTHARSRG
jgi:hypothetical protein